MQIDHVEIYVTDETVAAPWYDQVLGFKVVEEYMDWAEDGPLMIANDSGQMIALFEGDAQEDQPVRGIRRLAFRVDGHDFVRFVESSSEWSQSPLGPESIQDHRKAVSVYFNDPFGNALEVTTYDHQVAREFLASL